MKVGQATRSSPILTGPPEARATMRRSTIPGASAGCSQVVLTTVASGPAIASPANFEEP